MVGNRGVMKVDMKTKHEIKCNKGKSISFEFIDWFEAEWQKVTGRLKRSGADLSKIALKEA